MIPNYSQQDATVFYLFNSIEALHVSGGSSAHHQEHKTVHTALGIVKPILLPAAIVDEMELHAALLHSSTNELQCDRVSHCSLH